MIGSCDSDSTDAISREPMAGEHTAVCCWQVKVENFIAGDTRIRVPCMGIFELRDGQIATWRDYWDLGQFERQLPASSQAPA